MLTTLIYRSQLSLTCTSAALSALVEQARIRNTEQGISGILLSRGRDVLQILEGTEQSVVALFNTIRADDRHTGVVELMRTCPARLVLVTQGKEGVTAWQGGALTHYPASPVECIDTTGAGDAFVAGLLFGLARDGQARLSEVITLAQRCGALATTAKGAMTALPYHHEL